MVYYEHAHHQHVYDEHDDGWGSGSYWKRSLATPLDNNSAESVPITSAADRINISYNRPPVIATKQGPVATAAVAAAAPVYGPVPSYRPTTYEEQQLRDAQQQQQQQQLASYSDPHSLVYSQQIPQQYGLN